MTEQVTSTKCVSDWLNWCQSAHQVEGVPLTTLVDYEKRHRLLDDSNGLPLPIAHCLPKLIETLQHHGRQLSDNDDWLACWRTLHAPSESDSPVASQQPTPDFSSVTSVKAITRIPLTDFFKLPIASLDTLPFEILRQLPENYLLAYHEAYEQHDAAQLQKTASSRLFNNPINFLTPFPLRKPKASLSHQFSRQTPWHSVTYTAATPDCTVPYGVPARMLWYKIISDVVVKNARSIDFSDTLRDTLKELGVKITSGRSRGTLVTYRQQLANIIDCVITFQQSSPDFFNSDIIESGEGGLANVQDHETIDWRRTRKILVSPGSDLARRILDNEVVGEVPLTDEFIELVSRNAVPGHRQTILEIASTGSSLALDLYFWATHKNYILNRFQKRPFRYIPWKGLFQQFGMPGGNITRFKEDFRNACSIVQSHYSDLWLNLEDDKRIAFYRTRTHIPSLPIQPTVIEEN